MVEQVTKTVVTITAAQYEILDHRLTLPDCICEVFNDTEGHAAVNCTQEEVDTACDKLDEMAKAGALDFAELTEFDKLVLEDVLDGNNFLYWMEAAVGWGQDDISQQKYQGYCRAAENLEDKLEQVWKRVEIPR